MRLTIKAIEEALKRLGHDAQLVNANGYFYFTSGETADWLDRTVKVPTLGSLTLEQWIEEFERLKRINRELLGRGAKPEPKATSRPKRTRWP